MEVHSGRSRSKCVLRVYASSRWLVNNHPSQLWEQWLWARNVWLENTVNAVSRIWAEQRFSHETLEGTARYNLLCREVLAERDTSALDRTENSRGSDAITETWVLLLRSVHVPAGKTWSNIILHVQIVRSKSRGVFRARMFPFLEMRCDRIFSPSQSKIKFLYHSTFLRNE